MAVEQIACVSLAGLCLVTLSLAITGALYEMIGRWRDARRFPQRGHFVQVGSIRTNIACGGRGSPTVILESGLGGPSIDWLMVQPEVAKETKPSEDRFKGWVEEVDSGKELRFHSTGELIQFLGERFRAALQSCHKQVDQRDFGACEGEES